jgi:outer membrane murein-binding lipoprotein Lpp
MENAEVESKTQKELIQKLLSDIEELKKRMDRLENDVLRLKQGRKWV